MARFYGIPLEVYVVGQVWARENLPRLRREAGLELEGPAERGEMPQPEEPQIAATQYGSSSLVVSLPKDLREFTIRRLIGRFWPFGL
jgi:hypothetical protein